MAELSMRFALLYAELKRRKVVRIAIAYGVFAAAAIQLADPLAEALFLPGWTLTLVVVAVGAGFPIVIMLAWMFDITRETEPSSEPQVAAAESGSADARVYRLESPLMPLVGREDDLGTALQLLDRPDCRVLTLTGPGGIGKTRLAEEVGAKVMSRYRQGVCFVPLAGIEAVAALPAALADALGFELSSQPNATRQLAGFLREKNLLLILDNFEQIIDAAAMLTEIITRAPEVDLLVTSRRRLRITGETVLQLEALSLPQRAQPLEASGAGGFFLQIARRNDPGFQPDAAAAEAVLQICRIAGGIPLAIELAAASVGVLTCQEIAAELTQSHELLLGAPRDLPARHRSLHAVFESSWRLLDREERRTFRRLSVFRSGFDSEAAEVVAAAGLQQLARLVDASLLQRPPHRGFEMLEVLRQFAEEKLEAKPAEAGEVRARHSAFFLSQLADITTLPNSHEKDRALDRLAQRNADLRAAWSRAVADGRHEDLRRATTSMFRLLESRGRSAEGVELFGRAVAAIRPLTTVAADAAATATLARLLTRYAAFLMDIGEVSEAGQHLAEALTLLRAEGDRAEIAFALHKQCINARNTGDFFSPVFTECLELYRELADPAGIARALNALGGALFSRGEYEQAKRVYEESVALFQQCGLHAEAWAALNNLAGIASVKGDWQTARSILENELSAARKRINPRALTFLLTNLGYISSKSGDMPAARSYLAESAALARAMGYRGLLAYSINTLAGVQLQNGDVEAAADSYREALKVAVDAEEGPVITTILVGMARVYMLRDDPHRAAFILSAVASHPACDEETRTRARALLAELSVEDAPLSGAALDAAIQTVLEQESPVLSA